MRWFLLLFGLFYSISLFAQPYVLNSVARISHGDWTPISEKEMRSAAVDTALSEISKSGLFKLQTSALAMKSLDGELQLDVTLIGAVGIVKMTVSLHLDGLPSYVATTSLDIRNMDRQQIYNAFEFVGMETAKRLNAKVRLQKKQAIVTTHQATIVPQVIKEREVLHEKEVIYHREVVKERDVIHNHREVVKQIYLPAPTQNMSHMPMGASVAASEQTTQYFNQAQQFKRQGAFSKARAMYELLVEQAPDGDLQWVAMANDELRYGLPMFEAQMLSFSAGTELQSVVKNQQRAIFLYRQILADNSDNLQRVVEINARLDSMTVSKIALNQVMKSQSMANITPLKMMLMEAYSSVGDWPSRQHIQEMMERAMPTVQVSKYNIKQGQLHLVLEDQRYKNEITIVGRDGRITIR